MSSGVTSTRPSGNRRPCPQVVPVPGQPLIIRPESGNISISVVREIRSGPPVMCASPLPRPPLNASNLWRTPRRKRVSVLTCEHCDATNSEQDCQHRRSSAWGASRVGETASGIAPAPPTGRVRYCINRCIHIPVLVRYSIQARGSCIRGSGSKKASPLPTTSTRVGISLQTVWHRSIWSLGPVGNFATK
eukprot:COSAG03_NODE_62_length_15480_cov_14.902412_9_plen_190_part_00